eukprot:scaffold41084_cov66-Phaeocystis_antarctica.AAC.1
MLSGWCCARTSASSTSDALSEGRRAPDGPPRHETRPLSLDSGVLTLSCQTSADELSTRPHTRRRLARLQTELERRPVPPLSPGAPKSPSRTAVRADMAETRRALHPAISRGAAPELGLVVVAWGGHGEAR